MSSKNLLAIFFLFLILPLVSAISSISSNEVNIALYHLTPKQELCRCGAFNYNFIVYNIGSFDETYSFSVSRYAPNFNISPKIITIKPNETAKIGIGARIPCSLIKPEIDFIARTKTTNLKAKTPLQLSINSSCYAPDVNITTTKVVVSKGIKAISALFIFLMFMVMILTLMLILKQRPREYWWSSYFKLKPERKTTIIEFITIIIVVIFLLFLGLRGFQQIGRNETLITTFMGQKNVTQPTVPPITNVTIKPVSERMEAFSKTLCNVKQVLWPYKLYILLGLILLILIAIMSIIIVRRKSLRKRLKVEAEKVKAEKVKPEKMRGLHRIRWRYVIIPIIIIILLALIAVSAFLMYKHSSKIKPFLSQAITKLKLDKLKSFLLPKLKTALVFVGNAFEFVKPYLIYVVIGIILLAIIIFILRRRERVITKIVSVKKNLRKVRKKTTKKKK